MTKQDLMTANLASHYIPPADGYVGTFVGRAWVPDAISGPSVIWIQQDGTVFDISNTVATTSALFDLRDPAGVVRAAPKDRPLGSLKEILENSDPTARDPEKPWLLAPLDLQAIKAAGVTFAASLAERVVDEETKGDPAQAEQARRALSAEAGKDLSSIKPGSPEAMALRKSLLDQGLWSQYLEVGLGPDAEIFTKAQPMSAVGFGADVGIHPRSHWNNPEPEFVLLASSTGEVVGATLGNDVNLRDFEGRSALLLGRAKDNNASASVGPFVRLFDGTFGLDHLRAAILTMSVDGRDGFALDALSTMEDISRDILELVAATMGDTHQYPDGFALFTGTMVAPTKDRDEKGKGFTHKPGDIVTIASAWLGTLVNRVNYSNAVPRWEFGTRALMANLFARGLMSAAITPHVKMEKGKKIQTNGHSSTTH